jgi:hypothetical protein
MVLVLLALYCLNLLGGAPPSVTAVWAAGIICGALLLVWSWWTDRHREALSRRNIPANVSTNRARDSCSESTEEQLVFLLGAGASHGIGKKGRSVVPYCPPLMKHLYDKLAAEIPDEYGPGSALEQYADDFRADFEATFTRVVLKHANGGGAGPATPDTLTLLESQRSLALYFAQFSLLTGLPNYYSKLLAALQAADLIERTIFRTLNYECLFEQAAEQLKLRIDYSCKDRSPEILRVAKLHGSCNFLVEVPRSSLAWLSAPNVSAGTTMSYLPPSELKNLLKAKFSKYDPAFYPAMSQVSPFKEQLVASAKILEIRGKWQESVAKARKLAIIGVSFNENDAHVIEAIGKTPAEIFYVGGKYDFTKWKALNSRVTHISEKLEERFDRLLKRLRLA